MTDAYQRRGPLGRSLVTDLRRRSRRRSAARSPSTARGRIVTRLPLAAVAPPQARIIDPDTLATIATYNLPNAPDPPGTKTYQNFTGGGYFFLDNRDRIWVPTKTDHIFVIARVGRRAEPRQASATTT